MINSAEYQSRRMKLFSKMEEGSVAIIFAGVPKVCSADEDYPFEVNRNFYYLTGIEQSDSTLVLLKNGGELREYLFISPFDPVKEKWYGKRLTIEEAAMISGVRNVLINTALNTRVEHLLAGTNSTIESVRKVYLDLDREIKIADDTYTSDYKEALQSKFLGIKVMDIKPLIFNLRFVKSKAEIEEFRRAIAHTALGINSVMAEVRGGAKEYELADTFLKTINDDSGYQGLAFPTIMASGAHATILHYPTPLDTLKDGDLLLMDLGARHGYYCADVSRTVPIGGKFSPLQRKIYSIVLGCNKAVAKFARPGKTIKDLQAFTIEYLASECVNAGLLKSKDDISKVYFHGVSHHIGLDTHDPHDRELPLQEGCIISDEPGLYFADLGIGVRIEDDLLITANGAEVLTAEIIKEIDDIEAFYSHVR